MDRAKDFARRRLHSEDPDSLRNRVANASQSTRERVSGVLHRGKSDSGASNYDAQTHSARPISSLPDPGIYGPPPKRTSSGIQGASPSPTCQQPPSIPSRTSASPAQSSSSVESFHPAPARYASGASSPSTISASSRPPPPSLPPRLPPRRATDSPPVHPPTVAPRPAGTLNQGAVNRLGAAGISVPALGIGKPVDNNSRDSNTGSAAPESTWGGLPSSLNRLNLSRSPQSGSNAEVPASSEGTSFAEKKAALKTAAALRSDPGSVSLQDARTAAGTFNNFRQRHGDQVSSGMQAANSFNQKHDITGRMGVASESQTGQPKPPIGAVGTNLASQSLGLAAKKKPPPPPPSKRKPDFAPPIPMSTRPQ